MPNLIENLQAAEMILPEPFFDSCVAWRKYGLDLAEQMASSVKMALMGRFESVLLQERQPFFNGREYDRVAQEVNNYANNYRVRVGESDLDVRSDTVVANLQGLVKNQVNDCVMLSHTSIYRRCVGRLFFNDRRIYPTISFNTISEPEQMLEVVDKLKGTVEDYFDDFLLPYKWIVLREGYQKYGRYLLMPIMAEDNTTLSVLATLFVLSPEFEAVLGVKGKRLYDVGLTERVIAIYYGYQADRDYVVLPSRIAPVQCALVNSEDGRAPEIKRGLDNLGMRYGYFQMSARKVQKNNNLVARKGIPLQVYVDHNGQLCVRRTFDNHRVVLSELTELKSHLDESDRLIRQYNSVKFTATVANNLVEKHKRGEISDYADKNGLTVIGELFEGHAFQEDANFLLVPQGTSGRIKEKVSVKNGDDQAK